MTYDKPAAPYPAPNPPLRPDEERTWAIVGHLAPLVGVGFLAPLVIWLVFKGRGAYLENQSKESLNFQLTLLVAYVVVGIASLVTLGIAAILFLPLAVVQIVFAILAAVATSRYEWYRYPMNIRFIS
ncbi:DUF4870 domain-containing protein [Cellulomonas biazotea]|uniref:Membrane protein n=1 Tax=Cellulomonas biazotea TaxID=1709 RepID=A0A402DW29_9CELL|nr:DUF4870 domain-containing protein [Cellulomonas biazotea]GCE78327.1 membrane protein [Cellulomonas biazotea]